MDQEYVQVQETSRPALENYEPAHPFLGALLDASKPAPELQQGCCLAFWVSESQSYEEVPDEVSANQTPQPWRVARS